MHLNENNETIKIEENSFYQLDSIQNIFISKSTLNSNLTKSVMIELFQYKNRNFSKKVLKRSYFKSLFIISSYANESFDCLLSLYFMQNNVHYNFKYDNHFVDSRKKCIGLIIKSLSDSNSEFIIKYDANICLAIFFCLYLLFVVIVGVILAFGKQHQ